MYEENISQEFRLKTLSANIYFDEHALKTSGRHYSSSA